MVIITPKRIKRKFSLCSIKPLATETLVETKVQLDAFLTSALQMNVYPSTLLLVGEVGVNFAGRGVWRGQHNEFPAPLISVF
jgi:hypothetical protein